MAVVSCFGVRATEDRAAALFVGHVLCVDCCVSIVFLCCLYLAMLIHCVLFCVGFFTVFCLCRIDVMVL